LEASNPKAFLLMCQHKFLAWRTIRFSLP